MPAAPTPPEIRIDLTNIDDSEWSGRPYIETGDVRDLTWDELQSATPEVKAAYHKWWWGRVADPSLKNWMRDEKIDADIYERDKEWVH